jgi:hypothetical protein
MKLTQYTMRCHLEAFSFQIRLYISFFSFQIIWRPYLYVEVENQYESQKHIAKSITYVFAREITILHRPNLVPRQLFEGELNQ